MPLPMSWKRRGFTLIEILIVVLILGILLAIAVPQWMRARESARKTTCLSNLRQIDNAKEQFAIENRLNTGTAIEESDIFPEYIRGSSFPSCPVNGVYTVTPVGEVSFCSLHGDYLTD